MPLREDYREHLRELARRLDTAGRGERAGIVEEAQRLYGWDRATVYARLRRDVGWSSGRKTRADKGTTRAPDDALLKIAAMQKETMRANGKQTMHLPTALGLAHVNGFHPGVSPRQVARLLKDRRLDVDTQRLAEPVTAMRAAHPNHVHEVDPSLCLIYYLKGQQHVMRDDEFYKNKLDGYAKVKLKVWRYVLYDRASAAIAVRYFEAAGENQHNLFEFLLWAWGRKPELTLHGVPRILLWDKGSANGAAAVKNVLASLEVTPLTHERGRARVKGGVEGANNIVETQFESRLRFDPVDTVAALNAAVAAWCEAYNAGQVPGQDTRLDREGLDAPIARYALWHRIRQEELRLLPDVAVLQALFQGRPAERIVGRDLAVRYRHPQAGRSGVYSLAGLDGVCAGDSLEIRPLLYGDRAISVRVPRHDGEPFCYRVEPNRDYDDYGQIADAPLIGSQWRRPAATAIETATKRLDETAFPDVAGAAAIRKARDKGVTPFAGELDTVAHLQGLERLDWLPRRGVEIEVARQVYAEAQPMTVTQIALALKARGVAMDGERWARLREWYPQGAPEEELPRIVARLTGVIASAASG